MESTEPLELAEYLEKLGIDATVRSDNCTLQSRCPRNRYTWTLLLPDKTFSEHLLSIHRCYAPPQSYRLHHYIPSPRFSESFSYVWFCITRACVCMIADILNGAYGRPPEHPWCLRKFVVCPWCFVQVIKISPLIIATLLLASEDKPSWAWPIFYCFACKGNLESKYRIEF